MSVKHGGISLPFSRLMRVAVTGGAGFIGSNTVRLLCDLGHVVSVIDDLSTGHRQFVDPRARLVVGSIDDDAAADVVLDGAEVVMHFAASSTIQHTIEYPEAAVRNNVMRAVHLLESMRRNRVSRVVYSSTAAVYGEPQRVPIREDDPKMPLQPYGASKLAFEEILAAYHNSYGLSSVSLRYFNAYGPWDCQRPVTRAVPRWIRAALRQEPIGLNWNGEQLRDYVYVDDIAAAHVAAMSATGLSRYNIGSGSGVVMRTVAEDIVRLTNSSSPLVSAGERPGDPAQLVADISHAKQELGWRPTVSLVDGLQRTIRYYATLGCPD